MRREPLLTTAVITALIAALLRVFIEFGVPLSEGQTGALLDLVTVLAPFVVWAVGRYFVTPVADPRDNQGNPLVPASTRTHD